MVSRKGRLVTKSIAIELILPETRPMKAMIVNASNYMAVAIISNDSETPISDVRRLAGGSNRRLLY